MDKYEYGLKTEQLKKYALEGFFDEEALEICESINWKREKNVEILSIIAQVYEKYRKYEKALLTLERIYKISSAKRRNLYHIIHIALEYGDYDTAADYLEEYKYFAPRDTKSIFLEYRIAKGRLYSQLEQEEDKSDVKNQEVQGMKRIIPILEKYVQEECDEIGMYELAEAYHKVGQKEDCVAMCDQISVWFAVGPYVEKALRLKTVYVPLSDEQREMIENRNKYEERLKNFVNDLTISDEVPSFTTKEEARERAEKKAEQEAKQEKADKSRSIIVMTSLETLDAEQKKETEQKKENQEKIKLKETKQKEEKFAEYAKSIHNKSEKVSIDSLENIRRLKDDYSQKAEKIQAFLEEDEVASGEEEQNEKQQQMEKEPTVFVVDISKDIDVSNLGDLTKVGHFVIKTDVEKKGIQLAAVVLSEKIKQGESIKSETAYISGEKLNEVGVEETLAEISSEVLLVKRAGLLSDVSLWGLQTFMEQPDCKLRIVLIDTDGGIEEIWKRNAVLKDMFETLFWTKTMTVDELADYAVEYAASKDCVLHDMAYIPLYDIIEMIVEDKKGNEKNRVEDFMDYVIKNASGRKFTQILRNIFFVRQDDQGKVILYEKDFE